MKVSPSASKIKRIKGCLLIQNLTLDEWAKREGYSPHSVRTVLRRHPDLGSTTRITGIQTVEIISKLNKIIETNAPEVSNGD